MRHPLSLEAFTDWLATMPADERYNYLSNRRCAIVQYLQVAGFTDAEVDSADWWLPGGQERPLPRGWNHIAVRDPHTFGAALSRARELQQREEG